jgi:hypothetical protein
LEWTHQRRRELTPLMLRASKAYGCLVDSSRRTTRIYDAARHNAQGFAYVRDQWRVSTIARQMQAHYKRLSLELAIALEDRASSDRKRPSER